VRQTPRPLGGPISTGRFKLLLGAALVGALVLLWRFAAGLGATTGLNDGYPWGLWIAFEVVTGTALACGGYAVALLCYVANKGRYHPLVRPAVLTSALGYTIAGFAVAIDVGRYWWLYKVFLPWHWNLSSVLLEVALCISAYVVVLWIELSPAAIERWRAFAPARAAGRLLGLPGFARERAPRRAAPAPAPGLPALGVLLQDGGVPIERARAAPGAAAEPHLGGALLFIVALGLLLPTMHQSSLGSLMLVAGTKLHAFWHTPWLPLLFLVSCIAMGYAVVVFESLLSARAFQRTAELPLLRSLARVMACVQLGFLALRLLDLGASGKLQALALDRHALLLGTELLLFLAPALLLLLRRAPASASRLFVAAVLMLCAGALYRFDVYLIAFDPGPGWTYFPTVPEILVTLGLLAAEIAIYVAVVRRFPILPAPAALRSSAP